MKAKMTRPSDRREAADTKKSFADTEKSVKPVARDTNKTRRKNTLEPLKKAMRKKTAKSQGRCEGKNV